jgi:fimbrial chaperone protein
MVSAAPADSVRWRPWPIIAAALAAGTPALGAPLSVSPTQIDLTREKQSDLLSVLNDGDTEVRLQVEVFAWDQSASGEMLLQPTQDILAFPPLLTIAPHETKRIRVGTTLPPGPAEKGYRISLQELPSSPREGSTGVQILSRISLPIFLDPPSPKAEGQIDATQVSGGHLAFSVRNTGTRHFTLHSVHVEGMDAAGTRTLEASADGWYLLVGDRRDYRVELAEADCRKSKQIVLKALLDERQIETTIPVPAGACGAIAKTQFVVAAAKQ